MIVYLAIVAPDHEGPMILGVSSTLDLAKLRFSDQENEWDFNATYGQWWQRYRPEGGYNDNEIHPLEVDAP